MSQLLREWISLREAQFLLDRSETSTRKLLKAHKVRTKKVLTLRGRELRICLEDIMPLVPEDAHSAGQGSYLPAVGLVRPPARENDSSPGPHAGQILEEFTRALHELGAATAKQGQILETLLVQLKQQNDSHSESREAYSQLTDCLANMSRTTRAQTVALEQMRAELSESRARSTPLVWALVASVFVAVLLGASFVAATVFYKDRNSRTQLQAVQAKAASQQVIAEPGKRIQDLDSRLTSLEQAVVHAQGMSEKASADNLAKIRSEIQALRTAIYGDMEQFKRMYHIRMTQVEKSLRARNVELNRLSERVDELEGKKTNRDGAP